ncbi:30-kDa cleavage and polyadenylation specificity factor 30-like [Solanum pennellii]|uniref:30-kDa cleavage and polyadenylation specificity factor 30-like n=1 Tax=Solanum pennellii TaxID=28526 RepID=A0ABM1G6J7_SOLPN|nr:30-kDa cleavage and polyadenylation specificity factor 30-like [Solanum pennellii]
MDEGEGGLNFDFEGGLDTGPTHPTASVPVIQSFDHTAAAASSANINPPTVPAVGGQGDVGFVGNRRSFRQTVCRHWLRSLCMKGDACGFLHQYDKSRMPICRFFRLYGECREQDCVYKHTIEDIKECNMYKLGFCPNGPDCRYRHAKMPGPPPPVEEILQKIQHLASNNYCYSNRFNQNRNANYSTQTDKSQASQAQNGTSLAVKSTATETPIIQQHQPHQQVQPPQLQGGPTQAQIHPNGQQNQADRTAVVLPQGTSRYFIVKSCNRENLELSVQQGVWATQRSNEAKLNEAFDSVENVILIFSVNRTRHFQGCGKMTSRIGGAANGGNWKHEHGTAHYGRNFSLKWLKLCELSFQKTHHLRNPYNENLPVKISRDCQELEPSVGEQLASLLYLEPDSELMAISLAAESKRLEEKAKGVNPDNGKDNPDIVPFEDNEEEEDEEEESEDEDENFDQGFGPAALGRGRGRGIAWPPIMPFGHGNRPPPGMRGFPPGMMGDGFSYGAMTPEGFPMPDHFGMGPRPFPPYGPRFSSDLMFHGRPPAGGFGMMIGPGRPPFMGGMGPGATGPPRAGRAVGMNPSFIPPSSQPSQYPYRAKREQRAPVSDRNDRFSSDQGKGQETMGSVNGPDGVHMQIGKSEHDNQFGAGNSLKNDGSESEDEAPRRSRHGDGKKMRREVHEDAATGSENRCQ